MTYLYTCAFCSELVSACDTFTSFSLISGFSLTQCTASLFVSVSTVSLLSISSPVLLSTFSGSDCFFAVVSLFSV